MRAAFLVQKIGPYHHARFRAASRLGDLLAVEFRVHDTVYLWAPVGDDGGYRRESINAGSGMLARVMKFSNRCAVACSGYADPEIQTAMLSVGSVRGPIVICSDSTFEDEPRVWWREQIKRSILSGVSAVVVAGQRSSDYMLHLGVPKERQFWAWDVVDNEAFDQGATAARHCLRKRNGIPDRYFLCVARFVAKKNLPRLLMAYDAYRKAEQGTPWHLVISGSGPEAETLRHIVRSKRMEGDVHFSGFVQYEELPALYGRAGVFILPSISDQWGLVVNEAMACGIPVLVSERCGCAPDLVENGRNGFTFDPENVEELAALMTKMASLSEAERESMGRRSQEIIANYTPETFARGLWAAVDYAVLNPRRLSFSGRLLLEVLSRRRVS